MPTVAPTAPVLRVNGVVAPKASLDRLTSIRIQRGFCTVSRATLRFLDEGYRLSAGGTFAIGKPVEVREYVSGEVLFSGEVTAVALEQSAFSAPELVVVADDYLHRMSRAAVTKTYLQMTASEAITKSAQAAGLTASVTSTSGSFEYLVQGGTALNYVDQLAARNGYVWWCDYPKTLKVGKPDATSTSVDFDLAGAPTGMRTFSVRASARNSTSVKVTGWDVKQLQPVVGTDATARTKESSFVDISTGGFGSAELTRSDLAPLSQSEAETLAKSLNADASAESVRARGTGPVNAALVPGVLVDVKSAGPASGKYRVTEVEHRYDQSGFHTTFTAGPNRGAGLVDMLSTPRAEPGFALDNVITAIVTNIDDPDSLGRVKVKFPAIPGEPESAWARVVTVGGGAQRGALFLPEVNDEVLVAFEQGDTRRPVVLGGLYSSTNAFPGDNPVANGKVETRRLTSRTGHLVELSDAQGAEYVLIQHGKKKHLIKFENDKVDFTADAVPLKISNGQASIELKQNGDIAIDGNKITIKGKMDVEVGSDMNIKAKANLNVQAEATVQLQLKGTASADLQSGGLLNIKGSKVGING